MHISDPSSRSWSPNRSSTSGFRSSQLKIVVIVFVRFYGMCNYSMNLIIFHVLLCLHVRSRFFLLFNGSIVLKITLSFLQFYSNKILISQSRFAVVAYIIQGILLGFVLQYHNFVHLNNVYWHQLL